MELIYKLVGVVLRCPLRLSQSQYVGNTVETKPVNSTILSVSASGVPGPITYSISDLSPITDLFRITNNGEIKVKSDLKADSSDVYEFDVRATSAECTATARVSLTVRRNTNLPVIMPGQLPI